jgi:hypothetical protein
MIAEELAGAILRLVSRVEMRVRGACHRVKIEGTDFFEVLGEKVELSIPTVLGSEEEARDVVAELAAVAPAMELLDRFEREAFDFRVHAAVLRREMEAGEETSRRVVSAVGPPRCPTAVQVLRGRPGDALAVIGFMRSELLVPNLPLDVLNHLWAAGEAVDEAGLACGTSTNLTLLIGSLHIAADDPASFLHI